MSDKTNPTFKTRMQSLYEHVQQVGADFVADDGQFKRVLLTKEDTDIVPKLFAKGYKIDDSVDYGEDTIVVCMPSEQFNADVEAAAERIARALGADTSGELGKGVDLTTNTAEYAKPDTLDNIADRLPDEVETVEADEASNG